MKLFHTLLAGLALLGACASPPSAPSLAPVTSVDSVDAVGRMGSPALHALLDEQYAAPELRTRLRGEVIALLAGPTDDGFRAAGGGFDDRVRLVADRWRANTSSEDDPTPLLDLALCATLGMSSTGAAKPVVLTIGSAASSISTGARREAAAIEALLEAREAYVIRGTPLLPALLEVQCLHASTRAGIAAGALVRSIEGEGFEDSPYELGRLLEWAEGRRDEQVDDEEFAELEGFCRAVEEALLVSKVQEANTRGGDEGAKDAFAARTLLLANSAQQRVFPPPDGVGFFSHLIEYVGAIKAGEEDEIWKQPVKDARALRWFEAARSVDVPVGELGLLPSVDRVSAPSAGQEPAE